MTVEEIKEASVIVLDRRLEWLTLRLRSGRISEEERLEGEAIEDELTVRGKWTPWMAL